MLGDGHTRCRADYGGSRRDVKSSQPIAARADHIEDFARAGLGMKLRDDRFAAESPGEGSDFLNRFALAGQFTKKLRFGGRRHSFINKLLDRHGNLLLAERFGRRELLAEFFEHGESLRKGVACSNIKNRQQEEFR